MKKILVSLMIICVIGIMTVMVSADYANFPTGGSGTPEMNKAVGTVWNTFVLIVQVLSVIAVVFAGLRYMLASADKRADIKKSLAFLVIGAVLTFSASTIASFIVENGKQILQ